MFFSKVFLSFGISKQSDLVGIGLSLGKLHVIFPASENNVSIFAPPEVPAGKRYGGFAAPELPAAAAPKPRYEVMTEVFHFVYVLFCVCVFLLI